jgi:hypothetical protein
MSDRGKRISELKKIPFFAGVDHRHLLNGKGKHEIISKLPRSERRKLAIQAKKLARQYNRILKNLLTSGAGFPNDQLLRKMAIEYTHRYASSGIYNQPTSFNYFEPFCHIKLIQDSTAPYMKIAKEYDHLFYSTDFFDYLTSPDIDDFDLGTLCELPEEKAFHFTTNGDVKDISFLYSEDREFVISGFSMVRRGNYLHWYLIGGEVLSDEEWELRCANPSEISMDSIKPSKRAFLSESIAENDYSFGAPLPLEGTKTAIRTIISGEMDLLEKKHLSRCYMSEYENSFPVFCDDPEILVGIANTEQRNTYKIRMMEKLDKASVLWNLAEGLFQLPNYFNSRIPLEKEVLYKSGKRLSQKKGGKGIDNNYRIVSAIEVTESRPVPAIIKINLPHYEVETEGHWRRLSPEAIGHDRNGSEVVGKTWINASNKWKEPKKNSRTIFVKDSLATAKLKISEYIDAAARVEKTINQSTTHDQNYGELYVMRCSAMKETIFKVGYTDGDSSKRAEQLSSSTGVPLSFVVVKSWRHPNAAALETEVHMMLSPYRLNDGREFFLAAFSVIESIIEVAIERAT